MRAVVVGMVLLCLVSGCTKTPKTVTNTISMELIEIPAGTFTMNEFAYGGTVVTLTKPFLLGKTEVTQGQWTEVMRTAPWYGQDYVQDDKDCPATYVSWGEAADFCQKLTAIERKSGKLKAGEEYRLPTLAEWEYACRAGTTTAYSFGDDESKMGEYGWFHDNSFDAGEKYAHKVGLKKPNPWGLYDMHGNVAEWLHLGGWGGLTLSGENDPGRFAPEGYSSYHRELCGGDWQCAPQEASSTSQIFCEDVEDVWAGDCNMGFRVARSEVRLEKSTPAQGAELKTATNTIGMELIEIPGCYEADEEQVLVTPRKPFLLGKTEVTQGQWKQVMGTEPWDGQDYVQVDKDCPATFVSYYEAVEFCDKLTDLERKAAKLNVNEEYRLPTEAEWEFACRAGTTTAYSFGDESKLNSYAWWGGFDCRVPVQKLKLGPGNAGREQYAHKVGLKKPNLWGFHDMHGNVLEWCWDRYGQKLSGGTDPVGHEDHYSRVLRGGSWRSYPDDCPSAYRFSRHPSGRDDFVGFRVARSHPSP